MPDSAAADPYRLGKIRITGLTLPFDHSEPQLREAALRHLGIPDEELWSLEIAKRSIDARHKNAIVFVYTLDVAMAHPDKIMARASSIGGIAHTPNQAYDFRPAPAPKGLLRPVVVGAGPCGLFAALALAEWGFQPVLIERGKPASERAQEVAAFWRTGCLNPESNALFGEGGAGTFSDGKLTTQIKDPHHRCRKVLETLVSAGAPPEILYEHKPHIGTDQLIHLVENLRKAILEKGGEVRFDCRLDALDTADGAVRHARLSTGEALRTDSVVLAIGHSARDTFDMLFERGVSMEAKSFSVGVRIEHPQALIDRAQYGHAAENSRLGAAEYKLVHHCQDGRSVYTFCMCPGGAVIAAASEPEHLVTNGMSAYSRGGVNANSALLVGVHPPDYGGTGPLAGVAFQRRWEHLAFLLGGGDYRAPVQLAADFLAGRASTALGTVYPTYRPGVTLADLAECLPGFAVSALRDAMPALGRKLRGFDQPDAVLTGVETRSSSPVRILRDVLGQNPALRGLFPAGEGAGYAGGIMSAAVDGIRAAEAVASSMAHV